MVSILNEKLFSQKTEKVAKELLGKYLVRKIGTTVIEGMITETEAYVGPHDLACHASKGCTPRTEVMFGKPGTLYIYFIYGTHWMLNIVTEKQDYPAAVLLRGTDIASGPGRLTKVFNIDKELNNKIAQPEDGLWIEDRGINVSSRKILKTARIGVEYAGPVWSKKELRFVYVDNK